MRGIDLVAIEEADECCGFGGTFAVKNADTSMAMLSDKLRRVLDTRAEVCTAADNSCLMHIGGALRRQRAGVRTMHLAEILAARNEGLSRRGARRCGRAAAAQRRQGDDDDPREAERAVAELPDWEALRDAGAAIKARAMATLPEQLARLEESVTRGGGKRALGARRRGGQRDRGQVARAHGSPEVIKVKSLATDEIGLNEALAARASPRSRPTWQS